MAVSLPRRSVPAPSRQHPLSPEQQLVADWVTGGSGNAFIEAVAGSGKTSTLVAIAPLMSGTVAFAAFNRKIADEIASRVSGPLLRVGTFHSFGFGAWKRGRRCQVDGNGKSRAMIQALGVGPAYRRAVSKLVSIAKQSLCGVPGTGFEVEDLDVWKALIHHHDVMLLCEDTANLNQLIEYAIEGVLWSATQEEVIDFDDMLWLPLLNNTTLETYDWVLVDEAQDTNSARRMLARRMMKPGGRALFVGDRHQSIYGFTGADSDAVDLIFRDFAPCTSLPLTVTWRCCKAAVSMAQKWVPQIRAAESNPEGRVSSLGWGAFEKLWTQNPDSEHKPLGRGDAILCRNTRPLVSLAFRLLRSGVPARVEGRDIGKSLQALASRWRVSSIVGLSAALTQYESQEIARLTKEPDSDYLIESLRDRVETLRVLMDGCSTLDDLHSKIDLLFEDTDSQTQGSVVVLSTVHKAKGREWNRVFVLGWGELMPSKWARQTWQQTQETNLQYVAVTRAKTELVMLPLPD